MKPTLRDSVKCEWHEGTETGKGKYVEEQRHAVIVEVKLSDDGWGSEADKERLYDLEERLEEFFDENEVGEFDGNEIGNGYWTLYFYGTNADALFDAVKPFLDTIPLPAGSHATKQYGIENGPEARIDL